MLAVAKMNEFEISLLKYLSFDEINKIQKTKIGIAGCGGLGSNIAMVLVRTGFVDFEIVDVDIVNTDNLNRQNYFLHNIGNDKIDALELNLKTINPDVRIKKSKTYLTERNVIEYFSDRDVLFEAFDNVESKKMFFEQFANSGKLIVLGSGLAGYRNTKMEIKQIKEKVYIVGDGVTEAGSQNPPLAPRVTACASLMASVAVERILWKQNTKDL